MTLEYLPHTGVVLVPTITTSPRGNIEYDYTDPAQELTYRFWFQQGSAGERDADGTDQSVESWSAIAHIPDYEFQGYERVTGLGREFILFGLPEPAYTLTEYHHHEIRLRVNHG